MRFGTLLAALLMLPLHTESTYSQQPSVKQLDLEADRVRGEYLERLEKLAAGYEGAGETEKAKQTLRQILDLQPDDTAVREKLGQLEDLVFDKDSVSVEVDAARGWVSTGLTVQQGKPIRFEAEGTYRFISNLTVGPEGLPTADVSRDLVSGIDCGKLMGLVITPPRSPNRNQKPNLGTPFEIGAKSERQPEANGLLLLRLNIPSGTKSIGKVKVTISGNIQRTPATP